MNRSVLLGKALLEVLAEFAVFAALLFISAGTLLWPAGWAFIVLFFGFALSLVVWLARENPELLAERMSAPIQRGQPLWDKLFVAAVLVLFAAWLIVMPLDAVRFGWSDVPEEASATQQTLGSDLDALEAYIGSQQQVGVPADFGQRITKQG
jgi:hypothetical protein